jgi:hypothetical protein
MKIWYRKCYDPQEIHKEDLDIFIRTIILGKYSIILQLIDCRDVRCQWEYWKNWNCSTDTEDYTLKKKEFSNTGQNKFPNIRKPKNGFRG